MTNEEKISIIRNIGVEIHKINGNGEVQCYCPLHNDQDPSLMVNIKTGKFRCCAGCIKGRTFEDFVKKISGKEIRVEDDRTWKETFKERLYPKFDVERVPSIPLLPLAIGNAGEDYLLSSKRKLDASIIKKFNIMYWDSINAVVVPIEDVGYMARYIDEKKFKFVSGTRITDCLFSTKHIDLSKNKFIILVEGCFDALWMHKAGFPNTLALMHGDISDIQKKVLEWYQVPIYVMMDNDKTGEGDKIRDRIIKKIKGDFKVKTCKLPDYKDPNESSEEEIKYAILNAK
jgi:hypothetical protein